MAHIKRPCGFVDIGPYMALITDGPQRPAGVQAVTQITPAHVGRRVSRSPLKFRF